MKHKDGFHNNYFLVTEEKDGKYWASVIGIPFSYDLKGMFDGYKSVSLFGSKKWSEEIAADWNRRWKAEGKAIYG